MDGEGERRGRIPRMRASVPRIAPGWPRARRPGELGPALLFTGAAMAALGSLAFVYWILVLTPVGQSLENLAVAGAALRDEGEIAGSITDLSGISVISFGAAIVLVAAVGLARRRPGLALMSASVMAVSILLAEVLKDLLPRPQLVDAPPWLLANSFPSGHATIAASIGIGALLVAPDRLRWIVLPLAAAYAAVVAQAVQIAGWHRLSGTFGATLLATAVACAFLAALAAGGHVRRSTEGRVHPVVTRGLGMVAAGAVALGGLVALIGLVFPVLRAPVGSDSAFAHTALDLIGVGLTVATITTFSRLVEPFSLGGVESGVDDGPSGDAAGQATEAPGADRPRSRPRLRRPWGRT